MAKARSGPRTAKAAKAKAATVAKVARVAKGANATRGERPGGGAKARAKPGVPAASDGAVAAAERAATDGDWATAAVHLIGAWHAAPAPEIADAIALLDRRASPAPIDGRTLRDREAAWLELAARRDDESGLPALLAAPWPATPQLAEVRVAALVARLPSPRISHALVAALARRQYMSVAGRKLARAIARALFAHGDPAITRHFIDEAARMKPDLELTFGSLLRRRRPPIPQLPPAALAALARIGVLAAPTAAATAATHADLLAAVYAAPLDDGPREVLADALVLAGDPRGEFIALQLADHRGAGTPKTRRRARVLLRASGSQWHGGIQDDAATYRIDYARGFPATVVAATMPTFAQPGWATVEELELAIDVTFTFTGSPNLRALRRIGGLPADVIAALALPAPALVDDIAIVGTPAPLAHAGDTFAPTRLGFVGITDGSLRVAARSLAHWPIARRVTTLHVGISALDNLGLAYRLLADGPQLQAIELTSLDDPRWMPPRWTATCARDALHLTWLGNIDGAMSGPIYDLAPLAAFSPPASVSRLVATVPKHAARTTTLAQLAAHAQRWRAELVVRLSEPE